MAGGLHSLDDGAASLCLLLPVYTPPADCPSPAFTVVVEIALIFCLLLYFRCSWGGGGLRPLFLPAGPLARPGCCRRFQRAVIMAAPEALGRKGRPLYAHAIKLFTRDGIFYRRGVYYTAKRKRDGKFRRGPS